MSDRMNLKFMQIPPCSGIIPKWKIDKIDDEIRKQLRTRLVNGNFVMI